LKAVQGEDAEKDDRLNLITISRALDAMLEWHGLKRDKTGAPAIGHLLQVAGLAVKYRPNDTVVAVAALLHDVLEDVRDVSEGDLVAQFGNEVADIVRACSDSVGGARDQRDWCRRKLDYLAGLPIKDDPAVFVSLCDKVANARGLEVDIKASAHPQEFFRDHGFNESRPSVQLWYYASLANQFRKHPPHGADELVIELERAVASIQEVLGVGPTPCEPPVSSGGVDG